MVLLLTLRHARQTSVLQLLSPFLLFSSSTTTAAAATTSSDGSQSTEDIETHPRDVVAHSFRQWFQKPQPLPQQPLFDLIFEIISNEEDPSSSLSGLNLRLSESLVLDILNYGKAQAGLLSCLKFFDWSGRHTGFHHTPPTFHAIFRMLSKAKFMNLLSDFLQAYTKQKYLYRVRYYSVLVMGYAVAGKPDIALQLFGKMRFMGIDLDKFSCHVLMNSLVEQGYFDVVEIVAKEIKDRGFENEVTHLVMVKAFCKQNELDKAADYLRALVRDNRAQLSGLAVGILVDALCKDNQFERAALLIDEFERVGLVSMDCAYDLWITDLVKAGNLDGALEFLMDKQAVKGYVPDVFRYNMLICKLLRENRMEEVYDLLADMKEREVMPDDVTLNAILCFLCKGGMMDVAMDLYESRAEFGLSVNYMAYNYLINTLLGDGTLDKAYRVLRNSVEQGYLPGPKTLFFIADALCREGKLNKMKELVHFMLDHNIMSNRAYNKFISALCRAGRVEEVYWMHGLLDRLNKAARKSTYMNLISESSKSSRGPIAARLLIEMLEKGYSPSRKLVREVIYCLCKTDNPENHISRLLEIQRTCHQSSTSVIFNLFIDGAGRARKPELASQVYDRMRRNGIEPDLNSDILLLRSYLASKHIARALHLFYDLSMRWRKIKLWNTMIVGLCKAKEPEYASWILDNMKANKLRPSIECYEELIKVYCDLRQYYNAIDLVNDMTQMGRPVSSFIGNVFLFHALKTRNVYDAWAYLSHKQNLTPACWRLGHVIGVFSGFVEGDHEYEELEKLIQQCFCIDIYTHNLLLGKLSKNGMDDACKYFDKLRVKGFEANRWTYDVIVRSFAKDGRTTEARIWMEEMLRRGFNF